MIPQELAENTGITFEIKTNSILKLNEKQAVIQGLIDYFRSEGIQGVELRETCYYDRRSAEVGLVISVSLGVTASILSIITACWNIHRNLGQEKVKASVFVKREDGLYVKITDGMTKEDVINQLQKEDDEK